VQASVCVHAFPSLQGAPSGCAGLEHVPLDGLQVPAAWHWSCAVHTTGAPLLQAPLWQVSPSVQASPSLQAAPFGRGGFEQRPVCASQEPTRWHWSDAVQVTNPVGVQRPAWQASPVVHALPSLQVAPFGFCGFVHVPVDGMHVPAS
jgi:hypothetical protein